MHMASPVRYSPIDRSPRGIKELNFKAIKGRPSGRPIHSLECVVIFIDPNIPYVRQA
jgi:hypothetical protein